MIKTILMGLGAAGLVSGSYFGSTQLGLRTETWREVVVEVSETPSFDSLGQNLFTPDGTRLILTSIRPAGEVYGGKHRIRANVKVTERLALDVFRSRMVRTYSMDRVAVERTVREAAGLATGKFQPSEATWQELP
ncbi:hypothetical protein [Luteolibacter sp. Populi]|uniref:hypothetical protein n=1 Tax=Luteolibacter sp. Populi TaxID=3230487 RepID=UPI0034658716